VANQRYGKNEKSKTWLTGTSFVIASAWRLSRMASGNRLVALFTPVATPAAPRDAGNPARALRQSLSWRQILPLPHVTCQLLYHEKNPTARKLISLPTCPLCAGVSGYAKKWLQIPIAASPSQKISRYRSQPTPTSRSIANPAPHSAPLPHFAKRMSGVRLHYSDFIVSASRQSIPTTC